MKKAKIVTLANQKGGVGKTTTACALVAGLQEHGFKVLAVDLCPQGNLSFALGAERFKHATTYHLLKGDAAASEVIQHALLGDVMAANPQLESTESELVAQINRNARLAEGLEAILPFYDYIVIDTNPATGLLTTNALACADDVIIPLKPDRFSVDGLNQLNEAIELVRKYLNPTLTVCGVFFNCVDPRTNLAKDMRILTDLVAKHFNIPVFQTFIRTSVAISEAQAKQLNILDYKAKKDKTNAAQDFIQFVDEYLARSK